MEWQLVPKEPTVEMGNAGIEAWKGKRKHKNLGDVFITIDCLAMQLQNPDPTSIFVEHDGEIKEVSRAMIIEDSSTPLLDAPKV